MGAFLVTLLIGFLGALLFFALLIVGGYYGLHFWLRWKFGKAFDQIRQLSGMLTPSLVPPLRLSFRPETDLQWADEEALRRDTAFLIAEDFQQVGDFQGEESPVSLRAFVHPERRIWAAIQSLYGIKQWTDLVTWYEDGTTFACANLEDHGMDRPPWRTARFMPELSIPDLLEQFLAERPANKAMRPVSSADMPQVVSEAYAREMDWRIERGGVTAEEIARTLASDHQTAEPQTIRMIQAGWKSAISAFMDVQCRKRFLDDGSLSAREWEEVRDRILVVHDRTPAETLQFALCPDDEEGESDDVEPPRDLWSGPEDENEEEGVSPRLKALRQRLEVDNPRTVFAELNAELPESRQSTKLGQVSFNSVTADLYVRPEWDNAEYEDDDEGD